SSDSRTEAGVSMRRSPGRGASISDIPTEVVEGGRVVAADEAFEHRRAGVHLGAIGGVDGSPAPLDDAVVDVNARPASGNADAVRRDGAVRDVKLAAPLDAYRVPIECEI